MSRTRSETLFAPDGRLRQEYFTPSAIRALRAACDAAMRTGWPSVRTPHLFIGLLEEADEPIARWLSQNQLDAARLRTDFLDWFDMSEQLPARQIHLQAECFSEHLRQALQFAYERALQRGGPLITPADLLAAVFLCEPSVVCECLRRDGYDVASFVTSVKSI
jgi:ATP-dependent Clp protease ATP-binding subunit ClpA